MGCRPPTEKPNKDLGKASIRFSNRADDIGGWFSTLPARLLYFLHPGSCTMQPPVRNLTPARRSNDVAWAAICAQLGKVVVRRWDGAMGERSRANASADVICGPPSVVSPASALLVEGVGAYCDWGCFEGTDPSLMIRRLVCSWRSTRLSFGAIWPR